MFEQYIQEVCFVGGSIGMNELDLHLGDGFDPMEGDFAQDLVFGFGDRSDSKANSSRAFSD